MTGVVCCLVLLLTLYWVIPRLFSSSSAKGGGQRGSVQFIKKDRSVDLSKFSSQVDFDTEFTYRGSSSLSSGNKGSSWPRTPEEVRQEFDDYVYSTPLPKLPLFAERLKRPASATASQQVVVADRGAVAPAAENRQERRGFSLSFTQDGSEAPAVSAQESRQFQAKLFSDAKVGAEAQVKIQVLEAFVLNGCEIKKNTILTALARRSGNRMDIYLTSLPACDGWVNCNFIAYSTDGQRGLYLNAAERGFDSRSQTAVEADTREASHAATGLLSAYGGAAGRVLGSGLSDALHSSGRADNTVSLSEGTKILFKRTDHTHSTP